MYNQKEMAPFAHYQALYAAADAQEIAERVGIACQDGAFTVPLLARSYRIPHPHYEPQTVSALDTMLLRFLLVGHRCERSERFLTFGEMPWGDVYLQPFTGRILKRAAFTLGTDLNRLAQAAQRLGGVKLAHGDAAYEFEFFPNYHLRLILWQADEEFAPSAQILYSSNFAYFTAEDRVVIAELLLNELKR